MRVLFTDLVQLPTQSIVSYSQEMIGKKNWQSMMTRHTCPCCLNTLLRHARSHEVYWHCSYCYQQMPV